MRAVLAAAMAAAMVLAPPAGARRKAAEPLPIPTDTLVENVNGFTLDGKGELVRFNGLLIDDQGKVKQLLRQGDKRGYVKFRTDAKGRTLLPGFIATHVRLMPMGRDLLAQARAAAGQRQIRDNAVDEEAALGRALERLASLGVTMVQDTGTRLGDWLLYRRFGDERRLGVRIYAMADGVDVLDQVAPLRPTPWLYDGRLAMRAVLIDGEGGRPGADAADARLRNRMSRALMAHSQVSAAAADDGAQERILGAYAEMVPTYGRDRRYRLEASTVVPPERAKALAEMGVLVLNGAPTSAPANPFARLQESMAGAPGALPGALADLTTVPAFTAFAEDKAGTLEPGHWADFILTDQDPFSVSAGQIGAIRVLETWVGGQRVYVSGAMPNPAPSMSKQ